MGIVLGLAFFSHKVIRCMGTSICKMTAARGFCAELATAITVAIASRYGVLRPSFPSDSVPFSTSHTHSTSKCPCGLGLTAFQCKHL